MENRYDIHPIPPEPSRLSSRKLPDASVQPLGGWGEIGLSLCPGLQSGDGSGESRQCCLGEDLVRIRDWGAALILTLTEPHELSTSGSERLASGSGRLGMQWRHLPVRDRYPPGPAFEDGWQAVAGEIGALLRTGRRVLVHSIGGFGRAGTVAACLLVESGMGPEQAVECVRMAHPRAIDNALQEWYVWNYRPCLR